MFKHTLASFWTDLRSVYGSGTLVVAILVVLGLSQYTDYLQRLPFWAWILFAGLVLLFELMKVIYYESAHRFEPDAQRFQVQSALYGAAQRGRDIHASLLSKHKEGQVDSSLSDEATRWDKSTYDLIRDTLGEEEAE